MPLKVSLRQIVLAAVASVCATNFTVAQSFPAKPVTVMVPYPAGGLSDVLARIVSEPLAKALGQPVVVDNLGGASGSIAANKVLAQPADGYMVFQGSPNELILGPLANAAVKLNSEDFRMVQMIGAAELALVTRKDLPVTNGDELLAYAAKVAKEGKPLTYASVGTGTFYHLLGEHLSQKSGIAMTHVPYKGGAPANQDLLGGQVDIFITVFGKLYQDLAQQGRIKIIASLKPGRIDAIKNIPALSESRHPALKDFNFNIWTGYFVRKDTPEPVVASLHKSITEALKSKAVVDGFAAQSFEPAKPLSVGEAAKAYTDGIAQFRAIAKSINLQPQ